MSLGKTANQYGKYPMQKLCKYAQIASHSFKKDRQVTPMISNSSVSKGQ
jgi:hypothetical protein